MSNFRFVKNDSMPPVIKNLIILNVIVWLAQILFRSQNLTEHFALWPIQTEYFKPYQIFTHFFSHDTSGPFHILFNMLTLYIFGRVLENVWGHKRFLFFYLACGLGAAASQIIVGYFSSDINSVVGASGAVSGVMVAFAFLFPNTPLYIMLIPIPVKAKWAVLGFLAIDLFGGISPSPGDNIAHFAHLGGAITGFIIVLIWNKTNKKTLY